MDILKIKRIKIAQNEAAIPINAYILSPANKSLKFSRVALKINNADANTIKTSVKIFISGLLKFQFSLYKKGMVNLKIISYTNKSLTLAANNLTAIAKSTTPNAFLITPSPFLPSIFSNLEDNFKTIYTNIKFSIIAIRILTV